MKILRRIPLLLVLCLAIFVSPSLEAKAAVDYCPPTTSSGFSTSDDGTVIVYNNNGSDTAGACHIQKYHMARPGAGSFRVDGELKSQFNFAFDRKSMANIASIVIKNSQTTNDKKYSNRYNNEVYVATLNQDVKVVWVWEGTTKKVITMYPTKSYGSDGPIILPTKVTPVESESSIESTF